jgi:hypothetical protein
MLEAIAIAAGVGLLVGAGGGVWLGRLTMRGKVADGTVRIATLEAERDEADRRASEETETAAAVAVELQRASDALEDERAAHQQTREALAARETPGESLARLGGGS